MAKIYTGQTDEQIIRSARLKGLESESLPKWVFLRLALALSLKIPLPPDPAFERIEDRAGGSEYSYEQLTGEGLKDDFTEVFCALLSAYHEEDLFSNPELYRKYLQRHVRRGLYEIRACWKEGHDFHAFLAQDLLSEKRRERRQTKQGGIPDLQSVFLEIGVNGEIQNTIEGARLSRYFIHLQDLQDLKRLEKGLEKVAFSLGKEPGSLSLERTAEPRLIGLDILRDPTTWQEAAIDPAGLRLQKKGFRLPVSPGIEVMGKPFVFDLASAPHLLIGGTTGSGKSVCIHALILSLLENNRSEDLKLCLIDPKHVEYNEYESLDDYLLQSVITEPSEALNALESIREEMGERERQFARKGVRNIDDFTNEVGGVMPRIVVIVDELADLVLRNGEIESVLVTLAQKARSSGIHLILATQRPDARTFTGLLRSTIPSRIALTVQKSSESKILLDNVGAERLTGQGDMIVKLSGEKPVRVHGYHVKQENIRSCVHKLARR